MNKQEKIEFLKNAIFELKDVKVDALTEYTNLSDLGLDSLDIVELQVFYEEKTGSITMDPETSINTVGDLLKIMI